MDSDLPSRLIERLRKAPLPGRAAQVRFEPQLSYGRHFGPPASDARLAAVLMLLFPDDGDWRLPLVLRPRTWLPMAGRSACPAAPWNRAKRVPTRRCGSFKKNWEFPPRMFR